MNNTVKKIYDNVTPLWSDDELIERTLGKVKAMENNKLSSRKKRFGKPFAAICAAAVMAVAGTVTVGAVYKWNLRNFYDSIFMTNNQPMSEKLDVESVGKVDFSRLGVQLDKTLEFEGGRVRIAALLSDGVNGEIFHTLELDDPINADVRNVMPGLQLECLDKLTGEPIELSEAWGHVSNVINGVTYEQMMFSFNDGNLKNKEMKITLHKVYFFTPNDEDGTVEERDVIGEQSVVIDLDIPYDESLVRTVDVGGSVEIMGKTVGIDSIRLSPISLSCVSSSDSDSLKIVESVQEIWGEGDPAVKVETLDGSVLYVSDNTLSYRESDYGSKKMYIFNILPVDTTNVAAVWIGDCRIPLE